MTVDYNALSAENRLEYGRSIGRIGKPLLEDRYDKRTHFIFEVLQNAEDALRRRPGWDGSRTVTFALTAGELRISHFGAPFDGDDVKGICGIDESTKGVNSIGRFGIGFKSVYAFTRLPEIHSGTEAFSIVDYVHPHAIPAKPRDLHETLIVLPLKPDEPGAFDEIAEGLRSLGGEALLFLKQIDAIDWSIEGSGEGSYRRSTTGSGFMREVTLERAIGVETSRSGYVLFSRDVENDGVVVGQAELAFSVQHTEGKRHIVPLADARLVVFFPTVLPTYTGFLVQGPYQTTPSRDNIPWDQPWNATLAVLTADLLVDALGHLREEGLLDVAALRTLPLDRSKFSGLFAPLFERTAEAFRGRKLLPTSSDRFASAPELRLARAQDVRDLLGPRHLAELLGETGNVYWTHPDITQDRAPHLRSYLMQELKIPELTLDQVLVRMSDQFLAAQSDTWMIKLYRLLESQPALLRSTRGQAMALYRLEDGSHVPLMQHGVRQVFLPTGEKTGFPTLRASLNNSQTRKFLDLAKLTSPDPVDDVVRYILPNYLRATVDGATYAEDVARMVRAFETDSQAQKAKLIEALGTANVLKAKEAASGKVYYCRPNQVYWSSSRLTKLFAGVAGVYQVDGTQQALRGDAVRDMFDVAGAARQLRTIGFACDLTESEKSALRKASGWEGATQERLIPDLDIAGLEGLLVLLPTLSTEEKVERARVLWEALVELLERRSNVLSVLYQWTYMTSRSTYIDAKFLRRLRSTPWIPDANGVPRRPSELLFEDLDWPANPVLEARMGFKPPALAALAREVGIETDLLDELKRRGLTSLAQLRDLIGAEDDDADIEDDEENDDTSAATGADDASGVGSAREGGTESTASRNEQTSSGGNATGGGGGSQGSTGGQGGGQSGSGGASGGNSTGSGGGTRSEFISYVTTSPEQEDATDPDGLSHEARMDLEAAAIDFIVALEPWLERMPAGNKGYDLIERVEPEDAPRLIEVKAMKGTLKDRPATLSSAQMEEARKSEEMFWLYVVERAGTPQARLLKIQNPYRRTGTFLFDRGWEAVAVVGIDTRSDPVH